MIIEGKMTIQWRTRQGGEITLVSDMKPDETVTSFRLRVNKEAQNLGFEGHSGGWWRYAWYDFCKMLRKYNRYEYHR